MGYISKEEFLNVVKTFGWTASHLRTHYIPKEFVYDEVLACMLENALKDAPAPLCTNKLMDIEMAALEAKERGYKRIYDMGCAGLENKIKKAKEESTGNYWRSLDLLSYLTQTKIDDFSKYKKAVEESLPDLAEKKVKRHMANATECADSLETLKPENYRMATTSISYDIMEAERVAENNGIDISKEKKKILKKAYEISVSSAIRQADSKYKSSSEEAKKYLEMAIENSCRLGVSIHGGDRKFIDFLIKKKKPDYEEILKRYQTLGK